MMFTRPEFRSWVSYLNKGQAKNQDELLPVMMCSLKAHYTDEVLSDGGDNHEALTHDFDHAFAV